MCNLRRSFQSVSSIFPALHSRNVLLLPAIITSHIQTAVYFLPVSLLRSFIYIGLMTWWGISLWQRIVQTQVRRYLAATAALCVFWLSIRTVKFFFAATPAAIRYPLSLVRLLFPDAVHSASVRVRRALAGKARKLPTSQMDEPILYSRYAASAAGADERSASAGLRVPGRRNRMARHRSRLRRGLFYRHGMDRSGDGGGYRADAPQVPHPA